MSRPSPRTSSYPPIIDVGRAINDQVHDPVNVSNPLTYCTFPTVNAQFLHGSTGAAGFLYTPYSQNCQGFMTDYCLQQEWDGFCEAYSVINVDRTWPNNAGLDVTAQQYANSFQGFYPTVGENLIRNVVHRRFIMFPNKRVQFMPFDPNVANSPTISYSEPYVIESSHVMHLDDPASIHEDRFVQLMINHPRPCFDVLARIYLAVQRNEPHISIQGTILDKFLQQNRQLFNLFLEHAIGAIPSFQQGRITNNCPSCS